MARERSPNYPAYGLPAALQFVRMIWDKEKRTPVEIEVLATRLGSKSVSGPVRSKVASMRHYGLLEPVGRNLKVTDRAITLLLQEPGQSEYERTVREAALAPALFAELFKERPDASDDALNFQLVRDRRFSTDGAKLVIKSYRETLAFAKLDERSYNGEDDEFSGEGQDGPSSQPAPQRSVPTRPSDVKHVTFSFSLPSGAKAEVIFSGQPPTRRDAQKLRQYIELFEDDLEQPDSGIVKVAIRDEVDLS